jgi:hypothetical protein
MHRTVCKWTDIDGLSIFRPEAGPPAVFPIRLVSPTRSITLSLRTSFEVPFGQLRC